MINPVDVDNQLVFVDPADDPVLPDPGVASAGEFACERVADLLRIG
ncbi:MAG: hypothetical protein ACLQCU_13485 [Acidimicrobiales bacterium]